MKTLIESIEARLASEGYGTYFVSVPDAPAYPYVLLWTGSGRLEASTLAGTRDLRDSLGVTMVSTFALGVLEMSKIVRDALVGFAPASDAWDVAEFREPYDSQVVQPDRDVALPGSGYPFYAVDLYALDGTPKAVTVP